MTKNLPPATMILAQINVLIACEESQAGNYILDDLAKHNHR